MASFFHSYHLSQKSLEIFCNFNEKTLDKRRTVKYTNKARAMRGKWL